MPARYQVFVSSTYTDLRHERQAVLSTLLQLDAIPSGMELFPAADEEAWSLIRRFLSECDFYLLVIGGRYGSVDEEGLSYTEREYDLACELRIPVMAFLHENPDAIPVGKTDKDAALAERLEAFKEKIKQSKHVKYWANRDDLAGKVAMSYVFMTRNYEATGWVRADAIASSDAVARINDLVAEVQRLTAELESQRHTAPPGTDALAQGSDGHMVALDAAFTVFLPPTRGDREMGDRQSLSLAIELAWNEIFEIVGGCALNEASESTLKAALEAHIVRKHETDLDDAVIEKFEGWGWEYDPDERDGAGGTDYIVSIPNPEFTRILVQLMALGYIDRSRANTRITRDANAYWVLTPYGESLLIQMMAIPRGDKPF